MTLHFDLMTIEAKLDCDLAGLKAKTASARSSTSKLSVDPHVFAAFQPVLENDWGTLIASIPQEVHRRWSTGSARPEIRISGDLLGDFGEFSGSLVFRHRIGNPTKIARVIRAGGLKRPDFIVLDVTHGRMHALEVKSSFPSAPALARRMVSGAAKTIQLNLCSDNRSRCDEGRHQIGHEAVVLQRASLVGGAYLSMPTKQYGHSRVVAHASHVASVLFLERGYDSFSPGGMSRLSQPRECSLKCPACLCPGGPRLMVSIFSNNDGLVEPLMPEGLEPLKFFHAYDRLGSAIWMRNRSAVAHWMREVIGCLRQRQPGQIEYRAILFALDAMAAALEAGIIERADAIGLVYSLGNELVLDEIVAVHMGEAGLDGAEVTTRGQGVIAWVDAWLAESTGPQIEEARLLTLEADDVDIGLAEKFWEVDTGRTEFLIQDSESRVEMVGQMSSDRASLLVMGRADDCDVARHVVASLGHGMSLIHLPSRRPVMVFSCSKAMVDDATIAQSWMRWNARSVADFVNDGGCFVVELEREAQESEAISLVSSEVL